MVIDMQRECETCEKEMQEREKFSRGEAKEEGSKKVKDEQDEVTKGKEVEAWVDQVCKTCGREPGGWTGFGGRVGGEGERGGESYG